MNKAAFAFLAAIAISVACALPASALTSYWRSVGEGCTAGLAWGADCPQSGSCPTVRCGSGKTLVFICSSTGEGSLLCSSTDASVLNLRTTADSEGQMRTLCGVCR